MEFIEAPAFTRHVDEYLDDESYGALQEQLLANPSSGDVMPGTGGFRTALGRPASRQRPKGRSANYLLLFRVRATNLADDALWEA